MKIKIERLQDVPLPKYATPGSAACDLYAACKKEIIIEAGGKTIIPTGIKIALPVGFEAQIRPRSGWAAKHGITVLNSPGTIDSDYRGEIGVILINHDKNKDFTVSPGDRIAQMVIAPVLQVEWEETDTIENDTIRGEGGFGSTGTCG